MPALFYINLTGGGPKLTRQRVSGTVQTLEIMKIAINILVIALSIVLSAAVLLQGRGSGIGMAFGGDSNVYRTKRGLERGIYIATIVIAALLFGAAFANALI
jgi:preprotein translocase subunit SecG